MGGYRVQVPSSGTLVDAFNGMPDRLKAFVRAGVNVLSKVPPSNLELLFRAVLETIQSGESFSEAPVLTGALSLIASIASDRSESAEQFVNIAIDSKLIETADVGTLRMFLSAVIQNRQAVRRALQTSRLATQVLPSLSEFETTVDMRFGFEKGRLIESVPVILLHIDTDAQGQEIWLQLTKGQLERIIKELQDTLKNVERAEKVIEKSAIND
jgi:hypothetical protein